MCDESTHSHNGTRIHMRHCYLEGKARHPYGLQVKWIWWRISTEIQLLAAVLIFFWNLREMLPIQGSFT